MKDPQRSASRLSPILAVCPERNRRTLCGCLPLVLLLTAAAMSFPQTQRDLKTKPAAIPIVPSQNLDFSGDRLPSNFVPIPAAELYEAAGRTLVAPEKSEFETTAQYQARIEALAQKALLRGLKTSDDFAFVLRPSSRSSLAPCKSETTF
jgi:hypothetical protein